MTKTTKPVGHDGQSGPAEPDTQREPGIAGEDHVGSNDAEDVGSADGGQETVARLEAENADLKDRLLRALAEVENVRKRAERDVGDARQYAISGFASDVLSVADNIERALASVPTEARKGEIGIRTLIEGVELTERELQNVLAKHGIRKLTPVGERFDPNVHEALFEVPDPSLPPGSVSQVVEPGYTIASRPLRPAKVGVSR